MHRLVRAGALGALTLTLSNLSSGQLLDDGRCTPHGGRPPLLSLLRQPDGATTLFVQADPDHARGGAILFVSGEEGTELPPVRCVAGLEGTLTASRTLDLEGRATWSLPPDSAALVGSVRALTWPQHGSWGQVSVSNELALPPHRPTAPGLLPRLVITELQKNPTAVSDSAGEWFEVTNLGGVPVDLEGWTLADLGTDQTTLDNGGQGVVVPAGGRLVLGRNADPTQNGGVPVDHAYSGLTLSNADDELVLIRPDGTVADLVAYDDGVDWPDDDGASLSLDPGAVDPDLNDDGANWCSATTLIGGGPDTGTPGAENDDCGG